MLTRRVRHLVRVLGVLGGLAVSQICSATPDIVGTFSGTLNGNFLPSTPTTQTVTIIINSQNGTNFTGSLSVSPANLSTTFNGVFLNDSQVDVTCNGSSTIAAGPCFAAAFNGATLTIPAAGQVGSMVLIAVSGPDLELGGILNFSGAKTVQPEVAAGTTLKDAGTIQSEVNTIQNPIQGHLRKTLHGTAKGGRLDQTGFLLEGEGGLNAGDYQLDNVGVWLSYNYTATENDFFRTAFDSDRHTVVGGVDISPSDTYVFGLALAYENSDTDTTFNRGNLQSDGYTLAPYLGILLSDNWSLDASVGHSWIGNDQYRTDPTTGARINSDPDTSRFFMGSNLNGITFIDNWVIGGRLGFQFAKSETETFTESNGTLVSERETTLGQLRLGGDVAYTFRNFEPFVSALYERDYMFEEITLTAGPQPANDRDDIYFSTGVRYYGDNGLSANLEYARRFLREDFDEDSFTFTVRYDY